MGVNNPTTNGDAYDSIKNKVQLFNSLDITQPNLADYPECETAMPTGRNFITGQISQWEVL